MMAGSKTILLTTVVAGLLATTAFQPVRAQDGTQLVYQVQELLEEVRELRGLVEAQQREIENLRRRQRDQYLDLDRRLQQGGRPVADQFEDESIDDKAPEVARTEPIAASPVPDSPSSDVPEVRAPIETRPEVTPLPSPGLSGPRDLGTPGEQEQAAYDRAFRALREQRYADAAEGFSTFLDSHPDSVYAPNAQYWLAETYYVTRDFSTALRFFNQLLDRYPGSNKEGDALLKIGFSHFELRQWNEARAALEQVRSQHPDTTLARLAEGRLRDMRLAGHY